MGRRLALVFLVVGMTAALGIDATAANARTFVVRNPKAFERAAAALRHRGGTIVLRPGSYASLVLGPRSGGVLRVTGVRGVRVGRLVLWRTRRVSIGGLRIGPVAGDARLELDGAADVDLHDLVVSARGSSFGASIFIASAHRVRIRQSRFAHCADRSAGFANCITLPRDAQPDIGAYEWRP